MFTQINKFYEDHDREGNQSLRPLETRLRGVPTDCLRAMQRDCQCIPHFLDSFLLEQEFTTVAQGGKGKPMSESWIRRALPTYVGGPASEDL